MFELFSLETSKNICSAVSFYVLFCLFTSFASNFKHALINFLVLMFLALAGCPVVLFPVQDLSPYIMHIQVLDLIIISAILIHFFDLSFYQKLFNMILKTLDICFKTVLPSFNPLSYLKHLVDFYKNTNIWRFL